MKRYLLVLLVVGVWSGLFALAPFNFRLNAHKGSSSLRNAARLKAAVKRRSVFRQRFLNIFNPAVPRDWKGDFKCAVLLARFNGSVVDASSTKSAFETLFNTGAYSIKNYYKAVSGGQFNIEFIVYDWQDVSQTKAYYGNNENGIGDAYPKSARKYAEDAIAAHDAAGVDYSKFVNKKAGEIDFLIIVHPGMGGEVSVPLGRTDSENDIHSHFTYFPSPVTADGVNVPSYMIVPEYVIDTRPAQKTIGVITHEFGHALGLPDLYSTNDSNDGAGTFALMASGAWLGDAYFNYDGSRPAFMTAWCRYYLGWITPQYISEKKNVSIQPVAESGVVCRVGGTAQDTSSSGEYFLVEYRRNQKDNFDAKIPGSGLLIWHVDANVISTRMGSNTVNNEPTRKGLDLEEAGGAQELDIPYGENQNDGDANDFWKNSSAGFFMKSMPDSNYYNNFRSGVAITHIGAPEDTISFTVGRADFVSAVNTTKAFPNPFLSGIGDRITISYKFEEPPGGVIIQIFNKRGKLVRQLNSAYTELGDDTININLNQVDWSGKNELGEKVGSGLYYYRIISDKGPQILGKFSLVRR